MPSWTPPPPPPGGDPASAVENAVNNAVDGAGEVIDAVSDAVQGGDTGTGPVTPAAPAPIPIPYPVAMDVGGAVQDIGKFATQRASEIAGIVETSVGAVAGTVSETLARTLPVIIGVLAGVAGAGGVSRKVADVIGRVRSKVDRVVGVLTTLPTGAADGGQAATDAASGLRELERLARRDPEWQRMHLKRLAFQLTAKPRPGGTKGAPGIRTGTPGVSKSSDSDAACARRMLARLSLLEEKMRRLEAHLTARGPKYAIDARTLASLRTSLRMLPRAAMVSAAKKPASAPLSTLPGRAFVKPKF